MSTATLPKVVTIDALKAGPWRVMFLDASDHWMHVRRSPAFPGVAITDVGPRGPRSKVQRKRGYYVDGNEVGSLDAIVESLNKREEAP